MRKNVAKNGASIATRSPLRARKRVNNRLAEQTGHSEPIRAKSGTEPRKNARNGAKSRTTGDQRAQNEPSGTSRTTGTHGTAIQNDGRPRKSQARRARALFRQNDAGASFRSERRGLAYLE